MLRVRLRHTRCKEVLLDLLHRFCLRLSIEHKAGGFALARLTVFGTCARLLAAPVDYIS